MIAEIALSLTLTTTPSNCPVIDSYSSTCPTVEGTTIPPTVKGTKTGGNLPMTGAEFVGLIFVGAGSIVCGTSLIVAGRRRKKKP